VGGILTFAQDLIIVFEANNGTGELLIDWLVRSFAGGIRKSAYPITSACVTHADT
jgi:hypothetical protein